jgi:hypothetical protein
MGSIHLPQERDKERCHGTLGSIKSAFVFQRLNPTSTAEGQSYFNFKWLSLDLSGTSSIYLAERVRSIWPRETFSF